MLLRLAPVVFLLIGHFQIDVAIPFTKLQILFERDKALREKKVALHGANTGFVECRAAM